MDARIKAIDSNVKSIRMQAHEGQPSLIDTSVPVANTLELEGEGQNLNETSLCADIPLVGGFEESVIEMKPPQTLSPERKYEIH